ncbi:MAG TPA: pyruvate formate lyase family protein [Pyrinomonadaceae bacterium]|nr:pyruvate formate lyase family protein [Pyrinomonadaceae bacterium]
MNHNTVQYWQTISLLPEGHPDRPSPRVCRLLLRLFDRWKTKPRWLSEQDTGHLFDGKSKEEVARLSALPMAVRKGMAVARMLDVVTTKEVGTRAGTFIIDPDELIVGCLPPFAVGQGKEVVQYLTDSERLAAALNSLNEWSPMGHIVPDHGVVLEQGINGLLAQCRELEKAATAKKEKVFYKSVTHALKGVLLYAERFAGLAAQNAELYDDERRENLLRVAETLRHTPANPPRNFREAVQCIYLLHCALHLTAEIVPLGRLDQLLENFYTQDLKARRLTKTEAQEIIDCLWIKLDEVVILNNRHAEDRFTFCDGTLTGMRGTSNFDQGGLLNQWMQQVTIGGVKATNSRQAEDASNEVTYLCLEAARRLPVNSPTLDLRLHKKSPKRVIKAAAQTILSGGAHPVLLNDDRIVPALKDDTGGTVELKSARNYACDGCFETMFAGETEFSFGFVAAMAALEKSLNRGATIGAAGPIHLRGSNDGWRTPPAEEIKSFDELRAIMKKHLLLDSHRFLNNILNDYGSKEEVTPSPLLSVFIHNCIETGRDVTGGGSRYHLFSPLMVTISTCTDSLYAIRKLVFEDKVLTLAELVSCLRSNWGAAPIVIGQYVEPERIKAVRQLSLSLPKFGQGHKEIDEIAWSLISDFNDAVKSTLKDPVHKEKMEDLHRRYDRPGQKFEVLIAPGVGTFEQYVFNGGFWGASPDGRLSGQPVASDMSPAPIPQDLPATVETANGYRHLRSVPLTDGLRSYNDASINHLCDGAPADFNIREDFPEGELIKAIQTFADGKSSNVLTFTVANPETFIGAQQNPDEYDLLRVRMGGWTEFFITLFPDHQSQHMRRPLYVAPEGGAK